jgi:hypothetical protein
VTGIMRRRRNIESESAITFAPVDLFHFLSIFLCIVGVLAFLQTLMSSANSHKITMKGSGTQTFKEVYQIFCTPKGIIAVPPIEKLANLEKLVNGNDHEVIARVLAERKRMRPNTKQIEGSFMQLAQKMDAAQIEQMLDEIVEINRIATGVGYLYEEFILFGIYPGSGTVFHDFRSVMYKDKYEGLDKGYEALDFNWRFIYSDSEGRQRP